MINRVRKMHVVLAKVSFNLNLWLGSVNAAMSHLFSYLQGMNKREFSINWSEETWALSEVGLHLPQGAAQPVLAGKLGRRKLAKKTDFEPGEGFIPERVTDWVVCNFILDPVTEYLLFEERLPDVSKTQFVSAFSGLCKQAGEEYGFIDATLKVDRQHVYERIRQAEKIFTAQVYYHLPNPRIRDIYKPLLDDLDDNGAKAGKRVYTNSSGLQLNPKVLEAALEVSIDGYGSYKFRVQEKDGVRRTFTSSNDAIADTVETTDDPADFAARFYLSLERLKGKSKNGH